MTNHVRVRGPGGTIVLRADLGSSVSSRPSSLSPLYRLLVQLSCSLAASCTWQSMRTQQLCIRSCSASRAEFALLQLHAHQMHCNLECTTGMRKQLQCLRAGTAAIQGKGVAQDISQKPFKNS